MRRSILAMLLGFLALNALVIAGGVTLQLLGMLPADGRGVTPTFLAINLAFSLAGAVFGGLVCAIVAGRAPVAHVAALAGTVFFVSIGYTHRLWTATPPNMPHWYLLALLLGSPLGILLGGLWQQRRTAKLQPPEPQEQ